jgi:uncharacterized protein (TIGR01777 family)
MKVMVSGATGFVGKVLVRKLQQRGHAVTVLTRSIPQAALTLGADCHYIHWDFKKLISAEHFSGIDAVIHLAGESIAGARWDDAQKKKIYDSRINSTRNLVDSIIANGKNVKSFVSTSAIGIYGNRSGREILDESSTTANDFLAGVCRDWEAEVAKKMSQLPSTCIMRVGVVFGKNGGALEKLLPLFKLGLGGPVSSGKQVMSWIHVEDLADLYTYAIENENVSGIMNATAPNPVSNAQFAKTLGKVLNRPAFAWAPGFALELVLGEMSTIVLDGQYVMPKRALELGFNFKYPRVDQALAQIVK